LSRRLLGGDFIFFIKKEKEKKNSTEGWAGRGNLVEPREGRVVRCGPLGYLTLIAQYRLA